jgi:hypothetical protein
VRRSAPAPPSPEYRGGRRIGQGASAPVPTARWKQSRRSLSARRIWRSAASRRFLRSRVGRPAQRGGISLTCAVAQVGSTSARIGLASSNLPGRGCRSGSQNGAGATRPKESRCVGPQRAGGLGVRASVERSEADWRKCGSCRGVADEWHVDPEKHVTLEKLGSYPACPDSRKKRDLRAIRVADRRALRKCYRSAIGFDMTNQTRAPARMDLRVTSLMRRSITGPGRACKQRGERQRSA